MKISGTPAERWAVGLLSTFAATTFFFPLVVFHVPIAGDQEVSGYDVVSKINQFQRELESPRAEARFSNEENGSGGFPGSGIVSPFVTEPVPLPAECRALQPKADNEEKIQLLEKEVAGNIADPRFLDFAQLLFLQGRMEEAAESYQRYLASDPDNKGAHVLMGSTYFCLGRPTLALREFQRSLEIDPTFEVAMELIIWTHLQETHDNAAARSMWYRLHERNPNNAKLGQYNQMIDAADTPTIVNPSRSQGSSVSASRPTEEIPISVKSAWLIPFFIIGSFVFSLAALLGSFISMRLSRIGATAGTLCGTLVVLHIAVMNSDIHRLYQQSMAASASELREDPFAGIAQNVGTLFKNAFQLRPGIGLYTLIGLLALAAFLINSGLLSHASSEVQIGDGQHQP